MWSRSHGCCVACGCIDAKHMGKGLCKRCYFAKYNAEHAATVKEYKRRWHEANVAGTDRAKLARELRNYDGQRQSVLQRDGNRCVRCGSTSSLVVHHKDRTGRGRKSGHNNALTNLETVCRKCHVQEHRAELEAAKTKAAYCKNGHAFAEHGHHNGRQTICRVCCVERARKYRQQKAKAKGMS